LLRFANLDLSKSARERRRVLIEGIAESDSAIEAETVVDSATIKRIAGAEPFLPMLNFLRDVNQ
jgi:hypothetical protein